jgi:hypothetical protein
VRSGARGIRRSRRAIYGAAAWTLVLCTARSAAGFDALVSWTPVQGIAGYRLYIRQTGQTSATPSDVGLIAADAGGVVRYITHGLPTGVVNYLFVTAYDGAGQESAPSQELSVLVTVTPGTATATATATLAAARTSTSTPAPTGTATPTDTAVPTSTATRTANASSIATATRTVTRTATRTLPRSATPTVTPTLVPLAVGGSIAQYANGAPVPNVSLALAGASGVLGTSSDALGQFTVTGATTDTWQLVPQKIGDWQSSVTALDAAYVLQAVSGLRTLDDIAAQACDVTGNGSLSALDASRILQFAVGQLSRFAAAENCGSDWLFVPVGGGAQARAIVPVLSDPTCQPGAFAYEPLQSSMTQQNFLAATFGDCTGNWQSGAGGALRRVADGVQATLGTTRARPGRQWVVPLSITARTPINAVQAWVALKAPLASLESVRVGPAAHGAMLRSYTDTSGRLTIALAAASPLAPTDQPLVLLVFRGDAAPRATLLGVAVDDLPARAAE